MKYINFQQYTPAYNKAKTTMLSVFRVKYTPTYTSKSVR